MSPDTRFAPQIAALALPGDLRSLTLPALHIVMAMRLAALFDHAERDPLVELTARLGSVTAARHVLKLVRLVALSWPEPYRAGRPCCLRMTPDEWTLSAMIGAADGLDREGFAHQIAGFVPHDRHGPLFDQSVRCMAELSALHGRG